MHSKKFALAAAVLATLCTLPAVAQVKVGDRVKAGDLIAKPAEKALGARIHSSINGTVTDVSSSVTITA